jgi:hypothetical protein
MPLELLSKVIGIYFIIYSLAFLINPSFNKRILNDLSKSYGLSIIYGSSGIITGLSIIFSSNLCFDCINILMSIIGWTLLITGLVVIFFPKSIELMQKNIKKNYYYYTFNTILLVIGILIIYQIFFN